MKNMLLFLVWAVSTQAGTLEQPQACDFSENFSEPVQRVMKVFEGERPNFQTVLNLFSMQIDPKDTSLEEKIIKPMKMIILGEGEGLQGLSKHYMTRGEQVAMEAHLSTSAGLFFFYFINKIARMASESSFPKENSKLSLSLNDFCSVTVKKGDGTVSWKGLASNPSHVNKGSHLDFKCHYLAKKLFKQCAYHEEENFPQKFSFKQKEIPHVDYAWTLITDTFVKLDKEMQQHDKSGENFRSKIQDPLPEALKNPHAFLCLDKPNETLCFDGVKTYSGTAFEENEEGISVRVYSFPPYRTLEEVEVLKTQENKGFPDFMREAFELCRKNGECEEAYYAARCKMRGEDVRKVLAAMQETRADFVFSEMHTVVNNLLLHVENQDSFCHEAQEKSRMVRRVLGIPSFVKNFFYRKFLEEQKEIEKEIKEEINSFTKLLLKWSMEDMADFKPIQSKINSYMQKGAQEIPFFKSFHVLGESVASMWEKLKVVCAFKVTDYQGGRVFPEVSDEIKEYGCLHNFAVRHLNNVESFYQEKEGRGKKNKKREKKRK